MAKTASAANWSQVLLTHLGGLKPASADIALSKDALIAQDAIGLVLLIVQEVPELSLVGLA